MTTTIFKGETTQITIKDGDNMYGHPTNNNRTKFTTRILLDMIKHKKLEYNLNWFMQLSIENQNNTDTSIKNLKKDKKKKKKGRKKVVKNKKSWRKKVKR